jgi:hypothetical protein
MSGGRDEQVRRQLSGRVRRFLALRRSPRSVLSAVLVLTALAGFLISIGLLKLGLAAMWLRYPLAVLGAWGVFLALVRMWAESERESLRVDEELAALGSGNSGYEGKPGRSVLADGERRSSWWDWLDVPDVSGVADDFGGCLVGVVVLVALGALFGVFVALGGLIVQAEVILAEVLLDAVLISALSKRLKHLEPRWWLDGVLRQTVWPVVWTMVFLIATGFLMAHYAPGADSVGDVWRHWRGPQ